YYSVLDAANHGGKPVSVTLANLTGNLYDNGTPVLDIVTADQTPNGQTGAYYISILPNLADTDNTDTSGTFHNAFTVQVGQLPTQVAAGLFKTNGFKTAQDLIVSHDGPSKGVTLLLNKYQSNGGTIAFTVSEVAVSSSNVGFDPTSVAVGDFNNDGKLDFVVLSNNTLAGAYNIYLVEGDGAGKFSQVLGPYGLNPFIVPSAMAVGDFNREGFLDVVVVGAPTNGTTAAV